MNQLGKHMTLTVLLSLVSVSPSVADEDQEWQLEIGLSKTTYLLREPIWLDLTLTNISSDTVRTVGLFPPSEGPVKIELWDSMGNEMPFVGPVHEFFGPRSGFVLDTNEQYYYCYNLLELFNTHRGLLAAWFFGLLPAGKYTVQAQSAGAISQELEFVVVEPEGQEREAFQMLSEGFARILGKEVDLAHRIFEDVLERDSTSVYAEKALRELFRRREMLQRFPNSGYNQFNLKFLSSEEREKDPERFLEGVVSEHAGSRAARLAEQMIRMRDKEWKVINNKQ